MSGTLEHLDPTTLRIGDNVRDAVWSLGFLGRATLSTCLGAAPSRDEKQSALTYLASAS
jgi:hypothetical protein